MDPRNTVTEKGHHNGWTIYKHEGIPGLALPDPTYWVARKGEAEVVADSRKDVIRNADAQDSITPEDRAHAARVAAMLGF
jgi:hypothetical protein